MIERVAPIAPPWLNVSRETLAKLTRLLNEVLRWNAAINLISTDTIDLAWERHILDSAQLAGFVAGRSGLWVDLGSGGGFPGLVLAIIAAETAPSLQFALVESDRRKAEFLKQAVRTLALDVTVFVERVEQLEPLKADVASARALTGLTRLLPYAQRHLKPTGLALFLKGASYREEIGAAKIDWNFDVEIVSSRTDPSAGLLVIRNIVHV